MKKLGGTTFVYRAIDQDYNILETIKCLEECCDEVVVCVVESNDGTVELVKDNVSDKTKIIISPIEEWFNIKGREKLAHFQNVAASLLQSDYNLLIQSDEILHENSYDAVRKAIETDKEGFLVKRIHLWGSPYKMVEVPINRMPAGVHIIRMAKLGYRSYDDGENIFVPNPCSDFIDDIRIYHMGFVRDRRKMVEKCNHIQRDVFLVEPDKKLEGMEIFEPDKWFSDEDLKPIEEPLPKIIQEWAAKRVYE